MGPSTTGDPEQQSQSSHPTHTAADACPRCPPVMMPTTMGPSTTRPKKRSTLGWLSRDISSASCQNEAQWRSTCGKKAGRGSLWTHAVIASASENMCKQDRGPVALHLRATGRRARTGIVAQLFSTRSAATNAGAVCMQTEDLQSTVCITEASRHTPCQTSRPHRKHPHRPAPLWA